MHPQGSGRGRGAGGRGRRVAPPLRGPLCLLLCAALVVGLVPGSGMAWAAERDLEALAALGSALTGMSGDDDATTDGGGAGAADDVTPDEVAYSHRLLVSFGDGQSVRPGDMILGEREGTVLLGYGDATALDGALAWYSDPEHAAWAEVDRALGIAADGDVADVGEEPIAVGEHDNALTLLQAAEAASVSDERDPDVRRAASEAAAAASADVLSTDGDAASTAEAASLAASRAASRAHLLGDAASTVVLVALVDTGAPCGADGSPAEAVVTSESMVAAREGDGFPAPAIDRNGHATRMLATMAEENPAVRVISLQALDDSGRGSMSSLYAAVERAVSLGADVVNLSLAGRMAEGSVAVAEAISRATSSGVAVVAAAGNDGEDASGYVPASCEDALAVGAASADGAALPSSNWGPAVDLWTVAPSTSQAAARVSGWLSGNGISTDPSPSCVLRDDWRDALLGSDIGVHLAGEGGEAASSALAAVTATGDGSVAAAEGDAPRATMSGNATVTLSGVDLSAPTVGAALTATVDTGGVSYADALGSPTSLTEAEAAAIRYHFELRYDDAGGTAHVAGRADVAAGTTSATLSVSANAIGHAIYAVASDASGTVGGELRSAVTAGTVSARTDGVAYAALLDRGNPGYELNTLLLMRVPENAQPEEGDTTITDVAGNEWTVLRFWTGFEREAAYTVSDNAPWYESHASIVHVGVVPGQVVQPRHLAYWFLDFTNASLTFDFDGFDMSRATSGQMSLQGMFLNCSGITTLSLGQLDTSAAVLMDSMFENCTRLVSLDVSQLDTHNVTSMQRVFRQDAKLASLDLASFDTSQVTVMYHMFYGCKALTYLNVTSFDTRNLKTALRLFENCSSLTTLDVSSFRTSKVNSMYAWFSGCKSLTHLDLSNFDTSSVGTMYYMFQGCASLTHLDLSNFSTARVTTMDHMFSGCTRLQTLTIDKAKFKTSACTLMSAMFAGCGVLESLDVSGFETTKVTDMSSMFSGCSKLDIIDVSGFETGAALNMQSMFAGCSEVRALDVSGFNTANVTNISKMFSGCSLVEDLDVSAWRTSKVTSMESAFASCPLVEVLDLSGWDASSATTMKQMFFGDSSLRLLDLSNMDSSQVTNMQQMLTGCDALTSLDLGGRFSIEGVASATLLPDVSALDALESIYFGAWATYNATPEHASTKRSVTLPRAGATGGAQWWDAAGGQYDGGESITPLTSQEAQLLWTSGAPGIYACLADGVLTIRIEAGRPSEDWYEAELGATAWVPSGDGGATDVAAGTDSPGRPWEADRASITRVIFDGANGKVRPSSLSCWFRGLTSVVGVDLSGLDSSLAASMAHAFEGCGSLMSLDLSQLAATGATDLSYLFRGCASLASLDLDAWGVPAATNLSHLLDGCAALTSLDFSDLDTSVALDMTDLLAGCTGLEVLEMGGRFSLASVEASKLPSLAGLSSLRSVYLGAWSTYNGADPAPAQALSVTLPHAGDSTGAQWHDATGAAYAGGSLRAPTTPVQAQLMWGDAKPGIYARIDSGTLVFRIYAGMPDSAQGWYQTDLSDTAWDDSNDARPWDDSLSLITGVVFDDSNGKVRPRGMGEWFRGMTRLSSLDLSGLDSSQVTSFCDAFAQCSALRALDFASLDTSGATSLRGMFNECGALATADLSSWDTAQVQDMSMLFRNCRSLVAIDLSGVDTSQVAGMAELFYYCSALKSLDVSALDTSSATSMRQMFYACSSLTSLNIASFKMGAVQDVSGMFQSCGNISTFDMSRWETPSLLNMSNMFRSCGNIRVANFSSCDTSKVTDMTNLFMSCTYLNTVQLGGKFSIESVPDGKLPDLSKLASLTTVDLGAWTSYNEGRAEQDRRSVTLPSNTYVFGGGRTWWDGEGFSYVGGTTLTPMTAAQATLTWSAPQVYAGYTAATRTLTFRNGGDVAPAGFYSTKLTAVNWSSADSQPWKGVRTNIARVVFDDTRGGKMSPQYLAYWFSGCTSLEGVDLSGLDTAQVLSFKAAFDGCGALASIELSGLDTSAATNMSYMFQGCASLATLDVSRLFVGKVTNLSYLFKGCSRLSSLDLSRWDTSAVTSMSYLFRDCSSLTTLDLSSLDTSQVNDMTAMFAGCSSLRTLELGGQFSIASVTSDAKLPAISGLNSLTSVYLGAWVTYNDGRSEVARRSVTLPTPSGEPGAWWDSVPAPDTAQYQGGASVTPMTVAGARLVWGTARPGIYARLASGTLTVRVSSGTPAGTGWYASDLSNTLWASADEQPWAQARGTISAVVFDGSSGKAMPLDLSWWFAGLSSATSFDLSGLDSSQASDLSHLFDGCSSLEALDLSGVSTASASAMASMFDGCSSLHLVSLGYDFDFSGAASSPLTALPSPEGEASALWCRVRDRQGIAVYDGTGRTAAQLASSYDGAQASWRGLWEAQRAVVLGANGGEASGGESVQTRAVSLDQLVTKALAAGLARGYCGLAGWSATAPSSDAADVVPTLAWDATLADAQAA